MLKAVIVRKHYLLMNVPDKYEDSCSRCHVLLWHRSLQSEHRGLDYASDTNTCSEKEYLLLRSARVLFQHYHQPKPERHERVAYPKPIKISSCFRYDQSGDD